MNRHFSTLIASSVFTVGIISLSTLNAYAQANGNGNGNGNGGGSTNWTYNDRLDGIDLNDNKVGYCDNSSTSVNGFGIWNDCVGQVTVPNNDVGNGGDDTLLDFLNDDVLDDSNNSDPFNWLTNSSWLSAGSEIQDGNGNDGFFSSNDTDSGALKSGEWTFDLGNPLQTINALVISTKAASGYSAYFFDFTLNPLSGVLEGTWDTLGLLNNGGNQPAISHISAYYVLGDLIPPPPPQDPEDIPEPSSIFSLAFMVGAFKIMRRRKS